QAPALIEKPKPGDLIEIFRVGYKHWAIYIGSGFVVHLLCSLDFNNLRMLCCAVRCVSEKLEDVVGGDRWRINNYLDKKHKPQQIYTIVKQAVGFIGTRLPYNLVSSNCEHFATDLRYGKSTSLQVGGQRKTERSFRSAAEIRVSRLRSAHSNKTALHHETSSKHYIYHHHTRNMKH
uniref:LRAT domain-containing protein n=1 Tax=Poecilia latipinna TaxID=48699 RepID=A0A3B3UNP5_9TELE